MIFKDGVGFSWGWGGGGEERHTPKESETGIAPGWEKVESLSSPANMEEPEKKRHKEAEERRMRLTGRDLLALTRHRSRSRSSRSSIVHELLSWFRAPIFSPPPQNMFVFYGEVGKGKEHDMIIYVTCETVMAC